MNLLVIFYSGQLSISGMILRRNLISKSTHWHEFIIPIWETWEITNEIVNSKEKCQMVSYIETRRITNETVTPKENVEAIPLLETPNTTLVGSIDVDWPMYRSLLTWLYSTKRKTKLWRSTSHSSANCLIKSVRDCPTWRSSLVMLKLWRLEFYH